MIYNYIWTAIRVMRSCIIYGPTAIGLGLRWRVMGNMQSDMEYLKIALTDQHVHIRDRDAILQKVKTMVEEGKEKLLFLADFDMTLTRYWVSGRRGFTSYEVIEKTPLMSDAYKLQAAELKKKYHPIEVSSEISAEEKVQYMIEWWIAGHQLMVEHQVKKSMIQEATANANIAFREGCKELFSALSIENIPLLIFSAGLEDTVMETIKQYSTLTPNMYVVSNKLIFDETGTATAFSEPLVHTFNKGKSPDQLAAVTPFIEGRGNVVLMGDSQGDPRMPASLPHINNVLRIGFLNHDEEKLLEIYTGLYDIVLTGDADMSIAINILSAIIHK